MGLHILRSVHEFIFFFFQSFGQHGREIITTEVALHLLSILSGEFRMRGMNTDSFNNILNNLVIKVSA